MPSTKSTLILGLGAILIGLAILKTQDGEAGGSVQAGDAGTEINGTPQDLQEPNDDYPRTYQNFVERLGEFRAGQDDSLVGLRDEATRLAVDHGRPDAEVVAEYYAQLTASERRLGLAAYDEFLGIWNRVGEYSGERWDKDLGVFCTELDTLAARVLPTADFVPAGRALALAGEIEVQWLEFLETEDDLRQDVMLSARRHLQEALAIFSRAGMLTPKLQPLWLMGRLEVLDGREDLAHLHFEECSRLAELTRTESYREHAILRLIRLARARGDAVLTRELLVQLAGFRSPEECWELAREYAVLLIHRDEGERAAEFLIRNRPIKATDLDAWRFVLAIARVRTEDFEGARQLLDRLGESRTDEDSLLLEATLNIEERNSAAVLAALERPAAELPHMSERGRSRAAVLIGEAHLIEGRPSDTLKALAEAHRIFNSWEARLEQQSDLEATSATVMGEWLGLHSVVLEAQALIALDRSLEAALIIERGHSLAWRSELREQGPLSQPLTEGDLRGWAAHYEHGLVTWVLGADSGVAVHIAANGAAHGMVIPRRRMELQRAARRLCSALTMDDDRRIDRLSSDLVTALFPETLLDSLENASMSDGRLLCLAHGAVERLPLEALRVEGRSLDELAATLVLPELPARLPGLAATGEARWRLLGCPLDESGRDRLPATRDELDELSTIYPGAELRSGDMFNREALVEALRSGDSIHIATHQLSLAGCESARYAAVGLELSGAEVLCASEIANEESSANLIVLAACETAEGTRLDSRGLQGVARALLEAGARDLLVTLWPIRDEVARQFMPLFHRGIASGLGPSRAARSARRQLAESGVSAGAWAAYRVLGRD